MAELDNYMPGKVMAFNVSPEGQDPMIDETVLVEVVDAREGSIELAFNVPAPKRRMYLTLPMAALKRAMEEPAHD